MVVAGIDYGSKVAGTTAIALNEAGSILHFQSTKGKDADLFLQEIIAQYKPQLIGIDAPLSLPPGVLGKEGDFFYRQADRQLGAMSPMFLGGLTARAMQLTKKLIANGAVVVEVYPKATLNFHFEDLIPIYKKDEKLSLFAKHLSKKLQLTIKNEVKSWHEMDSILAWFSAYGHMQGYSNQFGNAQEGVIVV